MDMDISVNISSLNMPALVYTSHDQTIVSNREFDALSEDRAYLEYIKVNLKNTILNDRIQSSHYSLIKIDQSEYLVTFIYISDSRQFLMTVTSIESLKDIISEMDIIKNMQNDFFSMVGAIHDDFVVIDKNGVIVHALPNFETMYGISRQEAIGKTVYEMEERKIFNPSVAIRVFKSKKAETMLQFTGANKYLMCTAIPIKDKNNNIDKIISYTRDITKYQSLKEEYNNLENTLKLYSAELEQLRNSRDIFPSVIGKSAIIQNIVSTVQKISKFDATVLFLGASGVGKTMFAKLMHSQSDRKGGPFIEINCGAIPESLLESELFGYEKGAFSGANREGKPGLIELANNGTLFLDEIGDLPLHMQVKLLKTIQEKSITRVGGSTEKNLDFRLITATNRDLEELVKQGTFREDLFYRLNVITIKIPSLRERKEDIFSLCNYFVQKINQKYNVNRTLSNIVIDYLIEYEWPGNIRELENVIERLILTSDDYMITVDSLPSSITSNVLPSISSQNSLKEILSAVEKKVVLESYRKHKTSIGVAKELGISQPSASVKINKYLNSSE